MSNEERFADVTLEELVEEIERRTDCYCMAAIVKGEQRIPGQSLATMYFNGGFYSAIGLAEQLKHDLLNRSPRFAQFGEEQA